MSATFKTSLKFLTRFHAGKATELHVMSLLAHRQRSAALTPQSQRPSLSSPALNLALAMQRIFCSLPPFSKFPSSLCDLTSCSRIKQSEGPISFQGSLFTCSATTPPSFVPGPRSSGQRMLGTRRRRSPSFSGGYFRSDHPSRHRTAHKSKVHGPK